MENSARHNRPRAAGIFVNTFFFVQNDEKPQSEN